MKPFYSLLIASVILLFGNTVRAQIHPGQYTIYADHFTFEPGDSLHHPGITIDTSGMAPWQIGTTLKPFFASPDTPSHAIMTLRDSAYPVNVNKGFTMHIMVGSINPIFSFVHKFETDPGKD